LFASSTAWFARAKDSQSSNDAEFIPQFPEADVVEGSYRPILLKKPVSKRAIFRQFKERPTSLLLRKTDTAPPFERTRFRRRLHAFMGKYRD